MKLTELDEPARLQSGLWGRRPADWARLAEPSNVPLFEAVFDAIGLKSGMRILDAGCGSGLAAKIAADRGAKVTGIDATTELLSLAEQLVPAGDFLLGGLDTLPFADDEFDVVVGFNAFQFAGDPNRAVREAVRVTRPGGAVAVALFAEPERSESFFLHNALQGLVDQPKDHKPFGVSNAEQLRALMDSVGLPGAELGEVECVWSYPDVEAGVLALLASAGGAMAIDAVGETAVRDATTPLLEGVADPTSGEIHLNNVFQYAVGRVPAEA